MKRRPYRIMVVILGKQRGLDVLMDVDEQRPCPIEPIQKDLVDIFFETTITFFIYA
jgi:hypothetical protein